MDTRITEEKPSDRSNVHLMEETLRHYRENGIEDKPLTTDILEEVVMTKATNEGKVDNYVIAQSEVAISSDTMAQLLKEKLFPKPETKPDISRRTATLYILRALDAQMQMNYDLACGLQVNNWNLDLLIGELLDE